jgi:hypothetical protein
LRFRICILSGPFSKLIFSCFFCINNENNNNFNNNNNNGNNGLFDVLMYCNGSHFTLLRTLENNTNVFFFLYIYIQVYIGAYIFLNQFFNCFMLYYKKNTKIKTINNLMLNK